MSMFLKRGMSTTKIPCAPSRLYPNADTHIFALCVFHPGQLYSQSSVSRPQILWTKEGPSWDDDSYLGYSVAHGEFSGDKEADVAVGMPRGANLTGKVECSHQYHHIMYTIWLLIGGYLLFLAFKFL